MEQWEHAVWQDEKSEALRHLGNLATDEDFLCFDYYTKFIKMGNKAIASSTASEQCLWRDLGACVFSVRWFGPGICFVQYE